MFGVIAFACIAPHAGDHRLERNGQVGQFEAAPLSFGELVAERRMEEESNDARKAEARAQADETEDLLAVHPLGDVEVLVEVDLAALRAEQAENSADRGADQVAGNQPRLLQDIPGAQVDVARAPAAAGDADERLPAEFLVEFTRAEVIDVLLDHFVAGLLEDRKHGEEGATGLVDALATVASLDQDRSEGTHDATSPTGELGRSHEHVGPFRAPTPARGTGLEDLERSQRKRIAKLVLHPAAHDAGVFEQAGNQLVFHPLELKQLLLAVGVRR